MNIRLILASTIIGLSLVACNGGGSSPTPIGTVGATPTPGATTAPVTQSVVPTLATVNGIDTLTPSSLSTATLTGLGLSAAPTISGPTGILPATLPSVTYADAQPASIVTTFGRRGTLSTSRGRKQVASVTIPGATGLIYTSFTAPSALTIPAGASAIFTYPLSTTPAAGTQYNLAFFDGTNWNADTNDVGVVSGNTVTVTATSVTGATLASGTTYAVVLYSSPSTASPSPTPSAAPTFAPVTGTASVSSHHTDSTSITVDGATAQVVLPQASAFGSLAYTITPGVPTNVTPLSSNFGTTVNAVLGYAMVTPDTTVTFASGSVATATLVATGVPSGSYSLAFSNDGLNWVPGFGTSTVSGNNVTFSVTSTASITLNSGTPYYVAIYQ